MIQSSLLLRRALQADAIFSGASALMLSVTSGPLAALTQLPQALLFDAGVFLIGYVALLGWMISRSALPAPFVWIVILGNAAWMLGSMALIAAGPIAPNAMGLTALIAQAIVVGIFAELQFVGLRRSAFARA